MTEPIATLKGWIREDHARTLEQIMRECPALQITFEDSHGWRLIGSKNGQTIIDVNAKQLGRARSLFLSAYATCIVKGLIAA